nr:NIL domain-containing protein [Eggerthia catenaformis]
MGKRLILSDDIRTTDELKSNVQYRIVFNEQSSFEPVIANLILKFKKPVNILYANTRDVHGSAMGDMIVDFGEGDPSEMIAFLKERGLSVKEVNQ